MHPFNAKYVSIFVGALSVPKCTFSHLKQICISPIFSPWLSVPLHYPQAYMLPNVHWICIYLHSPAHNYRRDLAWGTLFLTYIYGRDLKNSVPPMLNPTYIHVYGWENVNSVILS